MTPFEELVASIKTGLETLVEAHHAQELEILRLNRICIEQALLLDEKASPVNYEQEKMN